MKNNVVNIIIVMLLICVPSIYSQNLEEMLIDPDIFIRREAIKIIIDGNLQEYIPNIEEAMFNQNEPFMIYTYLKALNTLQSENIVENSLDFIAYADNFENMRPKEDPLEMKVKATIFLFDAEDYSTVQYVFDIVNRDKPNVNADAILLLGRILNKLPGYSETAKDELQYIMNNAENETSRFNAMLFLSIFTESEYLSEYVNKFLADEDITVRDQALSHLFNLEYAGLKNLLLQQLSADPSEIMRAQIADSILIVYGEPSELKAVIDYQPNEPDPEVSTWMQFAINVFIPPKPDGLSYNDLFLRLISYTDELFQYEWIENEETRDYYAERLTEAYESIENTSEIGDACAVIDERILQQLEQDLAEELITIEGYKFLHYYTIYIKEEIEEEYGPCP